MKDKKLGAVEARFADLIWDNAPINSTALVRLRMRPGFNSRPRVAGDLTARA